MVCIHGAAEQVISAIRSQVRPVGEAGLESCAPIRLELQVAVGGCGYAVTVRINASEDGDEVIRGVGDQLRVMIGEEHAVVLDEVEQVGHLLEVGRYESGAVPGRVA